MPDVLVHYIRTIGGMNSVASMDFAKALRGEAHVGVVSGLPFGCDKKVRLSFATSMQQITEGPDRVEKWLA